MEEKSRPNVMVFMLHDLGDHLGCYGHRTVKSPFVDGLAEKGVPEQTLMAIAGHLSRQMLEHYSHVRMQAKREAVKAIDSFRPSEGVESEDQPIN